MERTKSNSSMCMPGKAPLWSSKWKHEFTPSKFFQLETTRKFNVRYAHYRQALKPNWFLQTFILPVCLINLGNILWYFIDFSIFSYIVWVCENWFCLWLNNAGLFHESRHTDAINARVSWIASFGQFSGTVFDMNYMRLWTMYRCVYRP